VAEKFNKLTAKQTIELADKLRQVCHFNVKTNYAEYDAGWSDERVALESEGKYTHGNVRGLRHDVVGSLRKRRGGPTQQTFELKSEVEALTALIETIEGRLVQLEQWAMARPKTPFEKP
jgi:hypothetical protein